MTRLLREARKFLVALAGLAANAVALGLVPPADLKWVMFGLTAATALGVYVTPNATKAA